MYRAVNTAKSKFKYVMDPGEQLRITDEIDAAGLDLGMIYHSHTRSDPYPSQTDVNFAAGWPGVEWLIVGLAGRGEPEVRSFRIDDGRIDEVPVEVTATDG